MYEFLLLKKNEFELVTSPMRSRERAVKMITAKKFKHNNELDY